MPRSSSHTGAAGPRTIAAVDAAFASTAVAAAQVTCVQVTSAGSPVRGSMMWWRRRPPYVQMRFWVDEVANA
jgi:hypothetical protein